MNITFTFALSLGTAITLLMVIVTASRRFGALELKVNTMWDFQIRRAMSEVVQGGLGKMNSPLVFHADAENHIAPLKEKLVGFFMEIHGARLGDAELLLAIERRFGDELLTSVCIPCDMSHGACLLLAMTVAKGSPDVNLSDIKFDKIRANRVLAASEKKR